MIKNQVLSKMLSMNHHAVLGPDALRFDLEAFIDHVVPPLLRVREGDNTNTSIGEDVVACVLKTSKRVKRKPEYVAGTMLAHLFVVDLTQPMQTLTVNKIDHYYSFHIATALHQLFVARTKQELGWQGDVWHHLFCATAIVARTAEPSKNAIYLTRLQPKRLIADAMRVARDNLRRRCIDHVGSFDRFHHNRCTQATKAVVDEIGGINMCHRDAMATLQALYKDTLPASASRTTVMMFRRAERLLGDTRHQHKEILRICRARELMHASDRLRGYASCVRACCHQNDTIYAEICKGDPRSPILVHTTAE